MTKKEIDISPKLYEAATESLVSDASATSTFEKMISVGFIHSTPETFILELKATEAKIKKEFEVGSMPSPWRSGKSVVVSAMKMNIKLVDDNGTFYGKSYLQSKIKEAKKDDTPITHDEFVTKVTNLLGNIPEHLVKHEIYSDLAKWLKDSK